MLRIIAAYINYINTSPIVYLAFRPLSWLAAGATIGFAVADNYVPAAILCALQIFFLPSLLEFKGLLTWNTINNYALFLVGHLSSTAAIVAAAVTASGDLQVGVMLGCTAVGAISIGMAHLGIFREEKVFFEMLQKKALEKFAEDQRKALEAAKQEDDSVE